MANRPFYTPQFFHNSRGPRQNANLVDLTQTKDIRDGNNASFLAYVVEQLKAIGSASNETTVAHSPTGEVAIALLGCFGMLGYGMRRSQEIVRFDRGPSYWSHAAIFPDGFDMAALEIEGKNGPWILEAALHPSGKHNDWLFRDGVTARRFADYSNAKFAWDSGTSAPNIAVISLAMTEDERARIRKAMLTPEAARLQYDFLGLAGQWFAYLTNRPELRNPLVDGRPMPSAAYVQMAYAAANIDLVPSSLSTTPTPEHFWSLASCLSNRAVYWDAKTRTSNERDVRCWFCIREPHCVVSPKGVRQIGLHEVIER